MEVTYIHKIPEDHYGECFVAIESSTSPRHPREPVYRWRVLRRQLWKDTLELAEAAALTNGVPVRKNDLGELGPHKHVLLKARKTNAPVLLYRNARGRWTAEWVDPGKRAEASARPARSRPIKLEDVCGWMDELKDA